MSGISADDNEKHRGRQEGERRRIRRVMAFLSLPGSIALNSGAVRSATPSGVGTLTPFGVWRRPVILGMILFAMMAALVAALIVVPQGSSGPPAALAQTTCLTPIVVLERRAEGFDIVFTYPETPGLLPTTYQYKYALVGDAFPTTPWKNLAGVGGVFTAPNLWWASVPIRGLPVHTEYKVTTRTRCGVPPNHTLSTVAADLTVTTEETRDYRVTLTKDGSAITELAEGEQATLTITMASATDVYDRDVVFHAYVIRIPHNYQGVDLPIIQIGEVTVTGSGAASTFIGARTLPSGQTSVSWTVTAVQDSIAHDADPADDEHPLESVFLDIQLHLASDGEIEAISGSKHVALRIRDGATAMMQTPPVTPVATPVATVDPANTRATGTVTIDDTTPEIGETLTASVSNVVDADGEPTGGFVYTYQWLRNGQPVPGATTDSYVVGVSDIGVTFAAQVRFLDALGVRETLTSVATIAVPSGAVIQAPNGYFWDDNTTSDDSITVDTSTMNYSYLPSGATFTYQWIYVDAGGTKEGDASGTDSMSQTYGLTSADDMKYMQVEVTFTDTNSASVMKLANMQTRQIAERPSLEIPTNVTATVPRNGGSVALSWGLTSLGGNTPSGFKYRYKPTALADTEFTAWATASGGASARSTTITGNLISNVEYVFEVASYSPQVVESEATTERAMAVYRHKMRDC